MVTFLLLVNMFLIGNSDEHLYFSGIGILHSGYSSEAKGVSGNGQVIFGSAESPEGARSIKWTKSGRLIDVDPGLNSSLYAGNYDGSIIFGHVSDQGVIKPAIWQGEFVYLTEVPDEGGSAHSCNSDGSIAVGYSDAFGIKAFRWENSTGIVNLGTLPNALASKAEAISPDGHIIVGWCGYPRGEVKAFKWSADLGMVDISQGNNSTFRFARDISSNGDVIVGQGVFDSLHRAAKWTPNELINLGVLPNTTQSDARSCSWDGKTIVGTCSSTAFYWHEYFGMKNLKSVLIDGHGLSEVKNWSLISANDTSDDGRTIVGNGVNPSGIREGFYIRLPSFGDINCDGRVSISDQTILLSNFGRSEMKWTDGDMNYDGSVNFIDLSILLSNYRFVSIEN